MSMLGWALTAFALAASPDCTVVSGASVLLDEGWSEPLQVVLRDERIVAVGANPPGLQLGFELPEGGAPATARFDGQPCALVRAEGRMLTPGFVDVGSQLGLVEVSGESSTRHDRGGSDPIQAALRAADGYDPLSSVIPVQRSGGITGAVIAPTGGWISGQGAFVRLRGQRWSDAVTEPSVALFARLGGGSTPERILMFRELARQTQAWRPRGRSADPVRVGGHDVSALDLEALLPVFRGQVPLVVDADRAADIEALLRWREEAGVRLIVRGGAEAWLVADALAAADVPVVVHAFVYGAGSFDQVHGRPDNPALLARAGVPLIVASFATHNARNLRQLAGNAVRDGLDPIEALRAVTSTPARVFGLEGRGVVAPGAHADLVLWTGDPLELSTQVEAMWIGGELQSLRSRHTELFEAYRELPGSPRPALSLP